MYSCRVPTIRWRCSRAVCAAASIKRARVRPSVRPSHHSTAAAACGGFAAERRASIDSGGRPAANAGSVMLTAAVDEAVNTDLLQLNHSVYRADVYRTIKYRTRVLRTCSYRTVHSVHMFRTGIRPTWLRTYTNGLTTEKKTILLAGLQCFDAVGWATGRASDL